MKNERRNGFYYLDDKRVYPSVTTILDVINKPALVTWAAKMGARAALADPSMTEEQAGYAIYQVKEGASLRGRAAHEFAEKYKSKQPIKLEDMAVEHRGFAKAFISFCEDYAPEILYQELKVWSDQYEFAGALDIIAKVKDKNVIIDIKTGKYVYDTYALQLAAYKQAVEEMQVEKIDKTAVLLLREDGNYTYEAVNADLEVFLAAKKIWLWQNNDKYNTRNTKIKKK